MEGGGEGGRGQNSQAACLRTEGQGGREGEGCMCVRARARVSVGAPVTYQL